MSQPNLYKKCYTGIAYSEFVSYRTRKMSMFLLIHFFTFSYFFPFNFIFYMKLSQSICLFIFSYSAISFFFPFNFIFYMKRVNPFAYSFFHIQLFLFLVFIFIFYMKRVNPFAYSLFRIEPILFSLLQPHILYETSQSICLFVFLHSAISFVLPSTSYFI